jgi:hypothetical protein
MKKGSLWGLGLLVAIGLIAYLLSTQVSWAKKRIVGPFDPTNTGAPGDSIPDKLHDRPGHDRNQDRTPDSTPDRVQKNSSTPDTPDCVGNFAGDNNGKCNSVDGGGVKGDATPEDHEGDGSNSGSVNMADGIPDASRYATINRAGERATDYTPDWPKSDTYLRRAGLPAIAGSGPGDATPDGRNSDVKIHDNIRDAVGRDYGGHTQGDATPDLVRDAVTPGAGADSDRTTGPDSTPDGIQDRVNHRDAGRFNGTQAGRDVVAYSFGPGDKQHDNARDKGGLSTVAGVASGGGGGGCSYSTTASADLGLMLAMLLPFMLAIGFRLVRKAAK